MEEFLTIIKKIRDICATLMKKNRIYTGTASKRKFPLDFTKHCLLGEFNIAT